MTRRRQKVLLWNMDIFFKTKVLRAEVRKSRIDILTTLVAEHAPSIVALQEAPPDFGRRQGLGPEYEVIPGPKGLALALHKAAWTLRGQEATEGWRGLVVQADPPAGGAGLRIWNIHAPPPGHFRTSEAVRTFVRTDVRDALRDVREEDPDRAELVVGDFNLPPYDDAVMGRDGLYARRIPEWVASKAAYEGARYRPLFNATWPVLGLVAPPYGDFYRDKDRHDVGPWYVPSQALMSARLATPGKRQVRLLERAGEQPLCDDRRKRPNKRVGSDHLPLLITFRAP
ncbi:endonuclease/exonuclease/phosphatase family protein [Sorangium sp. So ce861]|uniref:endonuclease/exonuclease/phosphatase family protein n=1 Tax=Sorangium sp. So ce861 TaxID=3133323 RepID=UPI003F63DD3B